MGDVNEDGNFTTFDLGVMSAWINGASSNSFPDSWCKFYPQGEVTIANLGTVLDQCITSDNMVAGDNDFTRVSLGDIDGSCGDCVHGDGIGDYPIVMEEDKSGVSIYLTSSHEYLHSMSLDIDFSKGELGSLCDDRLPTKHITRTPYGVIINWFDLSEKGDGISMKDKIEVARINNVSSRDVSIDLSSGNTVIGTNEGIYKPLETYQRNSNPQSKLYLHTNSQNLQLSSRCANYQWCEVINLNGTSVYSESITSNNIDLRHLQTASGIYIVLLSNGSDQIATHKVFID